MEDSSFLKEEESIPVTARVEGVCRFASSSVYSIGNLRVISAAIVKALRQVTISDEEWSIVDAGLVEYLDLDKTSIRVGLVVAARSGTQALVQFEEVERTISESVASLLIDDEPVKVICVPVFEIEWGLDRFSHDLFWSAFVEGGARKLPRGRVLSDDEVAGELCKRLSAQQ